ncbi:uncharacterized protein LOC144644392 isoform X2 [Oculina patagonica]
MAKTRSCISFCAAFSIALVLVVSCLIVVLRRDNAATEAVDETVENSQEFEVQPKEKISNTANSSSRIEPNSTHKQHHRHRQFCRKCCHTPPCWYNNHKECSKCIKKEQLELHVTRLLRRSHKKAMHHHKRPEKKNMKQ